jgi:hypothetical protein
MTSRSGAPHRERAGIDCEGFATDQPLLDAPAQDRLENPTKKIALTEAAMPVLAEGGVTAWTLHQQRLGNQARSHPIHEVGDRLALNHYQSDRRRVPG